MLAQLRIVAQAENDYWLILNRQLLEATVKRLRMYVLRSDVMLEDVSDQQVCLGLAGTDAEKLLKEEYPELPDAANAVLHYEQDTLIRVPDPLTARFMMMAPAERARELWQRWSAQVSVAGSRAWEWLDIRAGLPSIVPETVEQFVPLMVNLQHLDGVSFKKGCYPGQEIIARTHYLGKVKRRMYRAHSEETAPPAPGTDIYDDQSGGQSVGTVVNAQTSPDGGVDLLAVLQVSAEQAQLHLGDVAGPALQLQALPYSLEQAS
jgi:hypothetical protein